MIRAIKWCSLAAVLVHSAVLAAESPWQRVVVIGASASSGFILSEPFGGTNTDQCKLSRYLDAAIAAPHEPLKNLSSALLFIRPEAIAAQEIEAVTNTRPTLVIGVDFMFWFCYGDGATDAERAARFEYGLKLLESIRCQLIVGDIPDASSATNSGIISAAQVPSEAARAAANRRLREWAKSHPRVTVVSLDEIMNAVKANRGLKGNHLVWPAGKTRDLLQDDQLHPNPRGAAMLSLSILDAFAARNKHLPSADVRWNVDEVYRKGMESARPKTETALPPKQAAL